MHNTCTRRSQLQFQHICNVSVPASGVFRGFYATLCAVAAVCTPGHRRTRLRCLQRAGTSVSATQERPGRTERTLKRVCTSLSCLCGRWTNECPLLPFAAARIVSDAVYSVTMHVPLRRKRRSQCGAYRPRHRVCKPVVLRVLPDSVDDSGSPFFCPDCCARLYKDEMCISGGLRPCCRNGEVQPFEDNSPLSLRRIFRKKGWGDVDRRVNSCCTYATTAVSSLEDGGGFRQPQVPSLVRLTGNVTHFAQPALSGRDAPIAATASAMTKASKGWWLTPPSALPGLKTSVASFVTAVRRVLRVASAGEVFAEDAIGPDAPEFTLEFDSLPKTDEVRGRQVLIGPRNGATDADRFGVAALHLDCCLFHMCHPGYMPARTICQKRLPCRAQLHHACR